MINFKPLSSTTNNQILDCFNQSFSDYSIPFKLNVQQLETKLSSEDINKEISVGAFKDDRLIGFVLHGEREIAEKKLAYNAGTGVIPNERGKALTKRMYDFLLPTLGSQNFEKIMLEVISDNIPAIKSYKRIGFVSKRSLDCFKGEIDVKRINSEIRIKEKSDQNLVLPSKLGEISPTWQNSNETILNLANSVRQIHAYSADELVGYCILNSNNNRILQIAVKKKFRNRQIGSTLLCYIGDNISKTSSIINVDSNFNEVTRFFETNKFIKTVSQLEMELKLESK